MKCQSCSCPISSDFKYAYVTNCCPKCGGSLMNKQEQDLLLRIEEVLKEGNDLGDLAVWCVKTFLSDVLPVTPAEVHQEVKEVIETKEVNKLIPKSPPKKIKLISVQQEDKVLLTPEQTSVFAKRAGVDLLNKDKSKYATLIKDIQGEELTLESNEDYDEDNYEEIAEVSTEPLSQQEIHSVASIFDAPAANTHFSEIERLQKLEQMEMTGAVGRIRRLT